MSSHSLTRRAFLAALSAAPVVGRAAGPVPERTALVLGAGLSGLHAAWLLEQRGFAVTVLEARSRVGGRVHTLDDVPGRPEAGGEVVGGSYRRLRAGAERLGVALETPAAAPGPQGLTLVVRGQVFPVQQWSARAAGFGLHEHERDVPPPSLLGRYLRDGNPLTTGRDWVSPGHAALDATPLASWLRNRGASDEGLRLMGVAPNCNSLETASLLWAYRDGQRRLHGGTQTFLIAGGASRLPEHMAAALKRPVRFDRLVTRVSTGARGVEVRCANGERHRGQVAICTLPAPALARLTFTPELPVAQREAWAKLPYTAITKVMLDIRRPFWESDGLPPQMWTDGPLERLFTVAERGRLVGMRAWIDGEPARAFDRLPTAGRAAWVERELAAVRPSTAGAVSLRQVHSWQEDPLAGGAYAHFGPGHIGTLRPHLARPAGTLAFAGEHTAVEAPGMEAAFESAERAVDELVGTSSLQKEWI
jgi:monoamine oxidase